MIVPDHVHPAINTVVMDAVNDAVRHGNADWIEIHLEPGIDQVVLTVSNNGTRPPEELAGGLGAATLDRLATGGGLGRQTFWGSFASERGSPCLAVMSPRLWPNLGACYPHPPVWSP